MVPILEAWPKDWPLWLGFLLALLIPVGVIFGGALFVSGLSTYVERKVAAAI